MARIRIVPIVLALAALVVGSVPPAASAAPDQGKRTVTITHAPVSPILVQGSGIGAVRTFFVATEVDGKSDPGNYLTGTLTTVAVDGNASTELRSSNLIFTSGRQANQLVVGGISTYPAAGATLAVGQRTIRPIVGGSGMYNGARGYVVSRNLGDRGWVHTFHLLR